MSDKPLVQQALAQELADLVLLVPRAAAPSSSTSAAPACQAALGFLEGFWDAIVREWSGLDKWRMDKFYLLVRRFANAGFRLVAREQWDAAAVAELARIMRKQGGPMW
jgi:ribosomal RNA-processing protein 1